MIGKPLEFVISDLNISSMRRTIEAGDKEITTAQVKLTLQEIPIEAIKSVRFGKPNIVIPLTPGDAEGAAASAEIGPSRIGVEDPNYFEGDDDIESTPNFNVVNTAQANNRALGPLDAITTIDPLTGYAQWSPYGGTAPARLMGGTVA